MFCYSKELSDSFFVELPKLTYCEKLLSMEHNLQLWNSFAKIRIFLEICKVFSQKVYPLTVNSLEVSGRVLAFR